MNNPFPAGGSPDASGTDLWNNPTAGSPPRRHRWLIALIAAPLALFALCGAGSLIWWQSTGHDDTPARAVNAFYRALQSRDSGRVKDSLCQREQGRAKEIAQHVSSRLAGPQSRVEDIRWSLLKQKTLPGHRIGILAETTVVVSENSTTFSRQIPTKILVTDEGSWGRHNWKVCGASFRH